MDKNPKTVADLGPYARSSDNYLFQRIPSILGITKKLVGKEW